MIYQPREQGQGFTEYALILVLVAIVIITWLIFILPTIPDIYKNIT